MIRLWFKLRSLFKSRHLCGGCHRAPGVDTYGAAWSLCRHCFLPCCPWCSSQGSRTNRIHMTCDKRYRHIWHRWRADA